MTTIKINAKLAQQINEVIKLNPDLFAIEAENSIYIVGKYHYNLTYDKVVFVNQRYIKLQVFHDYPKSAPLLFINDAPEEMEHIYNDKSVCLATIGELNEYLSKSPSLLEFILKFVDSFLFSLQWFEQYGTYPFGEREHGSRGLLEYYKEKWDVDDQQFIKLVKIVIKNNYRGHINCVCHSKLKLRKCHGKFILPIVKDDTFRMKFLKEIDMITGGVKLND